jgi:hypothetical protein
MRRKIAALMVSGAVALSTAGLIATPAFANAAKAGHCQTRGTHGPNCIHGSGSQNGPKAFHQLARLVNSGPRA